MALPKTLAQRYKEFHMAAQTKIELHLPPGAEGLGTQGRVKNEDSESKAQKRGEQVQETLQAPEPVISRSKRPKVAVLVVHGVNAKTPDKEFSNLNGVTDLLTNHDFTSGGISYSVPEYTAVQVKIGDVPRGQKTSNGDRGTEYTGELLERFSQEPYYYKTQRRETTRRNLDRTNAGEDIDVHLYEMFWADLSRPVALSGLQTIVALFELLFNVCSLGRKSLRAAQAENRSTFTWPVLSVVQVSIEWITTLGIPLANAWFLGAALIYFPLTLNDAQRDAMIPALIGLLGIGLTMWGFYYFSRSHFRWFPTVVFGLLGGLLVFGFAWYIGAAHNGWGWLLSIVLMTVIVFFSIVVVLWISRHRGALPFWGAICLAASVSLGWRVAKAVAAVPEWWDNLQPGTLKAGVLQWADWLFAGSTCSWVALGLLNLLFMLLAAWALWRSSDDRFEKNRRALWTTCIANSVPAIVILVLTLGVWQVAAWALRVDEQSMSKMSPTALLPLHAYLQARGGDTSLIGQSLSQAAAAWLHVCRHPWIHYCYLFFLVGTTLALLAVLPQVKQEISRRTASNGTRNKRARWLGIATDDLFGLLRLCGEMFHRYLSVGAPLVIIYTWAFKDYLQHEVNLGHAPAIPENVALWHTVFSGFFGICFIVNQVAWNARAIRIAAGEKKPGWRAAFGRALTDPKALPDGPQATFGRLLCSGLILLICLLLPVVPFWINITWALGFSAALLLVGSVKLFQPILSVALDVLNWLRKDPITRNPRSRMLARYYGMLGWLSGCDQQYEGLVIIAHSQGTVLTVELFRYLDYLQCSLPADQKIYLFTMGCPLRQLYNLRFPDVYAWVGRQPSQAAIQLTPSQRITKWTNAYATGDYIGRNLWTGDDISYNPGTLFQDDGVRNEMCIGEGGHIRYWDWRCDEIAEELDRLIIELLSRNAPAKGQPSRSPTVTV